MSAVFRSVFTRSNVLTLLLSFLAIAVLWKGGKTLEMTWLLTAIAWCCALDEWRRGAGEKRSVSGALWLLVGGYVAATCTSYIASSTANYGLDEVLRTGALAMIAFWMLRTADDRTVARMHAVGAVTTLIACTVGVAVYLLQPVDRMVGTFFDARFHTDYWPNAWAEYLLLMWPVVLWWVWKAVRFLPLRLICMGVVFGCLALSYSRGATIVFVAQGLGWILLSMLSRPVATGWIKPLLLRSAAVLAVAGLLFVTANAVRGRAFPVQSVADKVTFSASEGTSSVSERSQFWEQALRMTAEKPLLGWGPYSFRFVQPRMQEHVLATSDHPHNVVLKIAAERGIPAALFFMGAIGLILISAALRVRHTPWSADAVMLLGAAGVLAHTLLDYNLQFVGIALPLWLWLGWLGRHVPHSLDVPLRAQRAAEVVLISVLMLVAVVEGRFLVLSSFGRHAEASGNTERALLWYERSANEQFSRDLHLSRASLLLSQQRVPEAEEALNAYEAQNAEDGRFWRLRGDACMAREDTACAVGAYRRAYEINGWNDLSTLRRLVESLEAQGAQEELAERKGEILNRMERFTVAIEQNTHFIALSHNVEELLLLTQRISALFPEEEPQLVVLGARASRNAEYERARLQSRTPGMLW